MFPTIRLTEFDQPGYSQHTFRRHAWLSPEKLDRAVIPTVNQQIWIVQVRKSRPYLEHVNTCDLSQLIGQQIPGQSIQSMFPDAQGRLWFTTSGIVDKQSPTWAASSPALVGTLVFAGRHPRL